MSIATFSVDGSLVCLGGYWQSVTDTGHNCYKTQGVRSEIAVYFQGTSLSLLCRFSGELMQISVDGAASTDWLDPNANTWGNASVVSGLAEGWHFVIIAGKQDGANGFKIDTAGGIVVTGASPAVATPPNYGPFYRLTDATIESKFVKTDPQTMLGDSTYSGFFVPGYDQTGFKGWGSGTARIGLTTCADSSIRFRASTSFVAIWGNCNAQQYTLYRNGVRIATVTGSGRTYGYVMLATGLDTTVAEYVINPTMSTYFWGLGVMLSPGSTLATPSVRGRLVGYGDSITLAGNGGSFNGYVAKVAAALNLDPVNRGESGRTLHDYSGSNGTNLIAVNTTRAAVNQSSLVTSVTGAVEKCVILMTTNDARNTPAASPYRGTSTIQSEMAGLLTTLLAGRPETTFYVLGPLDSGDAYATGVTGVNARLPAYRVALEAAVAQVANPRAVYISTNGWIDPNYPTSADTFDNLHPSATGYDKITTQLLTAITVAADSSSSSTSSLSSASSGSSLSSASSSSSSSHGHSESSSSSTASSPSSPSSESEGPIPLNANSAQNTYPSVLLNDDDPGRVSQIDQMVYQIVVAQPLRGPVTVDLGSPYANSEIRYTTSGKNPTNTSHLYTGPLVIARNLLGGNTVVKARAYDRRNSNLKGKIIKITFRIIPSH